MLLHELLIESASIYPNKIAVSFRNEKLSYNELHMLSDKLSFCCIQSGAGPGERVGIYIDKSVDAVVAIFGILKSGSCYVPLDPMASLERQILIINDCSLKYLITSSRKFSQLQRKLQHITSLKYVFIVDVAREEYKEHIQGITLFFKDDIFGMQASNSGKSRVQVTERDLAYILYTSGSTGQPKGVMISHNAALAFINWAYKTFNIQSNEIVSSHAPFHFDLSIFDIFVSIKAGATICLVPHGLSSFPKSVVDFIEHNRINTWYSVPSILIQLVLHGNLEKRKLPCLRQVLFAGEVFPPKYLHKLMELIPHATYYNLYGPTETNVITYHKVTDPPAEDKPIPIGILCDGVESFIVNESGSLVGKGEKGELYVSCPTLMNGYWNDPQKTESVLFKNKFVPSATTFIYKTGDIVSWNRDGKLDYHGRCDSLIKSRGYRIELGEIEAILSTHPGIKEVAVTAVPDDKIGNIIKVVLVAKNKGEISENDIKLFCSQKLTHYMIPEIVSIVDALPRTSTGKIDRKKLANKDI